MSDDLWGAAHLQMRKPEAGSVESTSKKKPGGRKPKYLLTGLARCAE